MKNIIAIYLRVLIICLPVSSGLFAFPILHEETSETSALTDRLLAYYRTNSINLIAIRVTQHSETSCRLDLIEEAQDRTTTFFDIQSVAASIDLCQLFYSSSHRHDPNEQAVLIINHDTDDDPDSDNVPIVSEHYSSHLDVATLRVEGWHIIPMPITGYSDNFDFSKLIAPDTSTEALTHFLLQLHNCQSVRDTLVLNDQLVVGECHLTSEIINPNTPSIITYRLMVNSNHVDVVETLFLPPASDKYEREILFTKRAAFPSVSTDIPVWMISVEAPAESQNLNDKLQALARIMDDIGDKHKAASRILRDAAPGYPVEDDPPPADHNIYTLRTSALPQIEPMNRFNGDYTMTKEDLCYCCGYAFCTGAVVTSIGFALGLDYASKNDKQIEKKLRQKNDEL